MKERERKWKVGDRVTERWEGVGRKEVEKAGGGGGGGGGTREKERARM